MSAEPGVDGVWSLEEVGSLLAGQGVQGETAHQVGLNKQLLISNQLYYEFYEE